MNDLKNKYKKYENQTFVYKGEKIFIQKIRELGGMVSIAIAGDMLYFSDYEVKEKFFDELESKFQKQDMESKLNSIESKEEKPVIETKVKEDRIFKEAAEFLKPKTEIKPMETKPEKTEVQTLNNLDIQLNSTGIFEGFDESREALLSALRKIKDADSPTAKDRAISESKAVSDLTGKINDMAKTKVQAAGLIMKYAK